MKKILRGILTFFLILFLGGIPSLVVFRKNISENVLGLYFKQEIIHEYLDSFQFSSKEEVKKSLEQDKQLTLITNHFGNQFLEDLLKAKESSLDIEELNRFFKESQNENFEIKEFKNQYLQLLTFFQENLSTREMNLVHGFILFTSKSFLIVEIVLFLLFLGILFALHTPFLLGINNLSIAFLLGSVLLGLISQYLEIFCSYAVSFFHLENTISLNGNYILSFLYLGLGILFWLLGKRILYQE